MLNEAEAKENLNKAIQEYVTTHFGNNVFVSDWIISVASNDMNQGPMTGTDYVHEYMGSMHSLMGLTMIQQGFVQELLEEEIINVRNDNDDN